VHHLPYTAERFYLLSELEQKVQFIFLDELLSDDDDYDDFDDNDNDTVSQVNVPAADHDVHGRDGGHDNNIMIGVDKDDVSSVTVTVAYQARTSLSDHHRLAQCGGRDK
jgi:hypothetical protein